MKLIEMYQELVRLGLVDEIEDDPKPVLQTMMPQTYTSFHTDIYVDITAGETDHAKLESSA